MTGPYHPDVILTGSYYRDVILTRPCYPDIILTGPYYADAILTGPYYPNMTLTGPYYPDALLTGTYYPGRNPPPLSVRDTQCYWVPAIFLITSPCASAKYTPYVATLFFCFSFLPYILPREVPERQPAEDCRQN